MSGAKPLAIVKDTIRTAAYAAAAQSKSRNGADVNKATDSVNR